MISEVSYLLCVLTSVVCALLLIRSYRKTGDRLLLWSSLCFVGLALNNVLLFVDRFVLPSINLELLRSGSALLALLLLLFGLIWEAR
jgi:Family of unknown function (DUF5985)